MKWSMQVASDDYNELEQLKTVIKNLLKDRVKAGFIRAMNTGEVKAMEEDEKLVEPS